MPPFDTRSTTFDIRADAAFDLGGPIRDALEATRAEARRRGLRITLSTPARMLRIAADEAAFRDAFGRGLRDTLDGLPDGAALRIEVRGVGGADASAAAGAEVVLTMGDVAWSLPLAVEPVRPPAMLDAASVVAASRAAGPLAGVRVLVADDSHDAANGLAALLRLSGAEAWAVFSGLAAVDGVRTREAQAVVLDLDMPGVDGCEAARRIRRGDTGRPVCLIALTGAVGRDDRERAHQAGFDHHLTKPVDIAALTALLITAAKPDSSR